LINRAENYQNKLNEARLNHGRVNTQAALARKLGISKARLTQIMNLLKLAPEIRSYIKDLDDPELLRYLNEKRLRKLTSIKNEKNQTIEFEKIKKIVP
jgi:DNA-binding XRE family transcriptional regulator